jgi:ribosomal protein S18 acetylase RimI-like enzyme
MDHVIRPAAPDDAEALGAFSRRTFLETFLEDLGAVYPPDDLEAFLQDSHSAETFRTYFASDSYDVLVAEGAGGLVGYTVTGPMSMDHAEATPFCGELKRLYVARPGQGTGLAERLFTLALERMARRWTGDEWLSVWSENHRAQRFYLKHGFEKAGEYAFPVGAHRDHEFIFRRRRVTLAL